MMETDDGKDETIGVWKLLIMMMIRKLWMSDIVDNTSN